MSESNGSKSMNQIIYIIDDHEIFLKGIHFLLIENKISSHIKTFIDEKVLMMQLEMETPFMIIADHLLEKGTGLELILKIKQKNKQVKALLISSIKDSDIKNLCMTHNIEGYIYKSENEKNTLTAIKTILNNGTYYSDSKINLHHERFTNEVNPFSKLTNRELEIVRFLVKGFQHNEIASQIGISPRTVHRHCENITEKMGKHSKSQLARKAFLWGVIKEEDYSNF
jgi:DNA-binding NarL/FixJ family response regulator